MKNNTFLFFALLLAGACSVQKNTVPDAAYAEKIVRKLAADEMRGRAAFSPEIDRAADFLASEMKTNGLQPMPGASDFLQKFSLTSIEKINCEVSLSDKKLPASEFFMVAGEEKPNFTGAFLTEKISETEDFRQRAGEIMSKEYEYPVLILAHPTHSEIFARYGAYYGKDSRLLEGKKEVSRLFLLTETEDAAGLEVAAAYKLTQKPLTNVIGYLPGKSKKDEFVIFSAHYDHIGMEPADSEGDSVANGADDDASGTSAVMALGRYFKEIDANERSLLFVAFTAEEIGLKGSQYFSQNIDAEKVTAMVNLEMIGKQAPEIGPGKAYITGFNESDFGKIMQKNLAGQKFEIMADPFPELNLFYRSDNATLARKGVPAHTFSTYGKSDKLYHSVNDEAESLNFAHMGEVIRAVALAVETLVNGQDAPTRVKPEKLR